MSKWADYGVSRVRYNSQHTHIDKVKIREDKGDTFGIEQEANRSWVVSAIENGTTFVTILKASNGKWQKGQDVHIVTINGVKYLRTDQNRQASDNLENLPEF